MSGRSRWSLALLILFLLVLVAISACDDDTICAPQVPAGTIQGTVRTGGVPFEATITASQVNPGLPDGISFEDTVAADGTYALDLPAGDYVVKLRFSPSGGTYRYARSGPSWGDLPADTLQIGSASVPQTADFNLGGIVFEADVPDVLENEEFRVRLHPRDGWEIPRYQGPVAAIGTRVSNGRVEVAMPGVLPGEYQVELEFGYRQYACNCPYDGEHIWLPGTRDRDASPWSIVGVDERVDLTCEFATTWASLEGSVTGAWQDMGFTEEPEIALVTPDSMVVIGLRRLVDGADFSIDVVWPEPVKMMVSDNGIEQWIGGSSFDQATVFDLVPGQVTQGADYVQNGLVLDLASVDFHVGSLVCRLCDPIDHSTIAAYELSSDVDRFVGITNLAAGDYILEIEPYSWDVGRAIWRPQWFDRTTSAAEAQVITIGDGGDIVTRDLVLEVGGQIRGTVQQVTEPPVSFYVMVTTADDEVVWGYDYAWDHLQEFAVTGLPDGSFKIGVSPLDLGWDRPGPAPEGTIWYPGTTDWSTAAVFEIENAEVLEGVVIEVP